MRLLAGGPHRRRPACSKRGRASYNQGTVSWQALKTAPRGQGGTSGSRSAIGRNRLRSPRPKVTGRGPGPPFLLRRASGAKTQPVNRPGTRDQGERRSSRSCPGKKDQKKGNQTRFLDRRIPAGGQDRQFSWRGLAQAHSPSGVIVPEGRIAGQDDLLQASTMGSCRGGPQYRGEPRVQERSKGLRTEVQGGRRCAILDVSGRLHTVGGGRAPPKKEPWTAGQHCSRRWLARGELHLIGATNRRRVPQGGWE